MIQVAEKYQRRAGTLSTESGGETILVRLSDGRFFGLGETGTLIWDRLAQPSTLGDLLDTLHETCEAVPETAGRDITVFIAELQREGLVESASEAIEQPVGQAVEVVRPKRNYTAPRLDRGTLRQAAAGNSGTADGGLTTGGLPGGLS